MSPKPQEGTLSQAGFTGCRMTTGGPQEECLLMENMYVETPSGPMVARPGVSGAATTGETSATQCIGDFYSTIRAQRIEFAIRNGEIWRSLWGSPTWSKQVTAANFATAGITLSASRIVYWVEFQGEVVFNDEANQAWTWDGQDGATGLTLLSNAPATAVGRPQVYHGKVFFIKSNNTLVWSEEGDANLGYEAGIYNNAWDVRQTSSDPITAIHAENEGLYYWRRNAIGKITGAVTPDFSTTGVDDDISTAIGTVAPGSVAEKDGTIFFLDASRHPYAVRDDQLVELWKQLPRGFFERTVRWGSGRGAWTTLEDEWYFSAVYSQYSQCIYNPGTDHVLMFLAGSVTGTNIPVLSPALVFDATTLRLQGYWSFGTDITCVGPGTYLPTTPIGYTTILLGLRSVAYTARMTSIGNAEVDTMSGSDAYYPRRVIGPPQGWSIGHSWNVIDADILTSVPVSSDGSVRQRLDVMLRNPTFQNYYSDPDNTQLESWHVGAGATGGVQDSVERRIRLEPPPTSGRWLAMDLLISYRNAAGTEITGTNTRVFGWTINATQTKADIEGLD